MSGADMKKILALTKALSDGSRLRTVMALRKTEEMCVCQVTEMLGLAPATVSRHMSVLQNAGIVESRKDGRWVYYRLSEEARTARIAAVIELLAGSLERSPEIREDRKYIRKIVGCGAAHYCSSGSCGKE
jgi:ArsR family transcriptional regulator